MDGSCECHLVMDCDACVILEKGVAFRRKVLLLEKDPEQHNLSPTGHCVSSLSGTLSSGACMMEE